MYIFNNIKYCYFCTLYFYNFLINHKYFIILNIYVYITKIQNKPKYIRIMHKRFASS